MSAKQLFKKILLFFVQASQEASLDQRIEEIRRKNQQAEARHRVSYEYVFSDMLVAKMIKFLKGLGRHSEVLRVMQDP